MCFTLTPIAIDIDITIINHTLVEHEPDESGLYSGKHLHNQLEKSQIYENRCVYIYIYDTFSKPELG